MTDHWQMENKYTIQVRSRKPLLLVLKGMGMGVAEVIPGVSGGTIAFITGIYAQLIDCIKSFDAQAVKLLFTAKWRELWNHIHGSFLVFLLTGMVGGVIIGVFGISRLMETRPEILWAFFFGLIIASAIYVGKQVKKWSVAVVILSIAGAALAFWITLVTPTEASLSPPYVFLCGMIAISALILPGISGSFIMLLMGMYTVIIPMVKSLLKDQDLSVLGTLAIFGIGCIVGLATFSRVLSWMFRNYADHTLGLLSGFMIGSLFKIWPWRNPIRWMDDSGQMLDADQVATLSGSALEHLRIVSELNVLPADYTAGSPQVVLVVLSALFGFAIVFLLERYF